MGCPSSNLFLHHHRRRNSRVIEKLAEGIVISLGSATKEWVDRVGDRQTIRAENALFGFDVHDLTDILSTRANLQNMQLDIFYIEEIRRITFILSHSVTRCVPGRSSRHSAVSSMILGQDL